MFGNILREIRDRIKVWLIGCVLKIWRIVKPFFQLKAIPTQDKIKKIVVVVPGGLGDVIAHLPALKYVRMVYPNAEITVVVPRYSSILLKGCPFFDRMVLKPSLVKLWLFLLFKRFDLGINLDTFSENFAFFFGGVKFRIGYNINENDIFLNRSAEGGIEKHAYLYALDIIGLLKPSHEIRKKIKLEDTVKYLAVKKSRLLKNTKIDFSESIGIVIGGGRNPWRESPEKRIPLEFYKKIIRRIRSIYPKSSFIFIGDKFDRKRVLEIKDFLDKNKINYVDLTGKTSIEDLPEIISRIKVIITPDTFAMHLSSFLGVPTFIFFLSTPPKLVLLPSLRNEDYLDLRGGKDLGKEDLNKLISFVRKYLDKKI